MSDVFTFTVPGGFQRTEEILALAKRLRATGKPVQLVAYDTVQGLSWNGGRLTFSPELFPDKDLPFAPYSVSRIPEALERARALNREGIGFHLVFNNVLESLDVEDEDGNDLLRGLHHEMNGVTIATESLRSHVAEHYPKYEKTASICFAYMEEAQYQRALTRYEKVVMMPHLAYEPERLKGFPLDRLVFIANDECYLFCPRKDHYAQISRCSQGGNISPRDQAMNLRRMDCLGRNTDYWDRTNQALDQEWARKIWMDRWEQLKSEGHAEDSREALMAITPATRRQLISLGVRCFKLQGREYNAESYQDRVVDFIEQMVRDELPG